jgi:hypothetical protein
MSSVNCNVPSRPVKTAPLKSLGELSHVRLRIRERRESSRRGYLIAFSANSHTRRRRVTRSSEQDLRLTPSKSRTTLATEGTEQAAVRAGTWPQHTFCPGVHSEIATSIVQPGPRLSSDSMHVASISSPNLLQEQRAPSRPETNCVAPVDPHLTRTAVTRQTLHLAAFGPGPSRPVVSVLGLTRGYFRAQGALAQKQSGSPLGSVSKSQGSNPHLAESLSVPPPSFGGRLPVGLRPHSFKIPPSAQRPSTLLPVSPPSPRCCSSS